jgi:hypothetical protein
MASAATTTLEIEGVSNTDIECENGLENCVFGEVARVQCPAGTDPVSVTVTVGPTDMETCISAQNTAGSSSCYNVQQVNHEQLELEVNGFLVNGGAELDPPVDPPVEPLNTGGSGQTIEELGGCNDGFSPDTLYTYRRPAGGSIQVCTILETDLNVITKTYVPSDPEWDTYYGDPGSDPVTVRFAARADSLVEQSGTWTGGVFTDARGTVTILPECTDIPDNVPAIGPMGLGALLFGLSGLGVLVGLRRRG